MATAQDVIRNSLDTSDFIFNLYMGDLTDDDLVVTAVPGMNPIAWHLGHVISVERDMVEPLKPGSCPALPDGFAAAHGKETAVPNAFRRFGSKDMYVNAWKAQRAATLAVVDGMTAEQLDAPTGVEWAPTTYGMLNIAGLHALGHLGQCVPVRRKLGKPVVF
jgi:hypothetical protein